MSSSSTSGVGLRKRYTAPTQLRKRYTAPTQLRLLAQLFANGKRVLAGHDERDDKFDLRPRHDDEEE